MKDMRPYLNMHVNRLEKHVEHIDRRYNNLTSIKTVMMIDERTILRESLLEMLNQQSDDLSFISFSTINDAIEHTKELEGKYDLCLLNIGSAPLSEDFLGLNIGKLREAYPETPLAVLADNDELLSLKLYVCLGLSGFMTTSISSGELAAAIKLVLAGGRYIPESLILKLQRDLQQLEEQRIDIGHSQTIGDATFTPRQLEVLEMLYYGKSNKVIAYQLNVRESTVKVHVRDIMKKLCASNRTQVAYLVSKLFDGKPVSFQ